MRSMRWVKAMALIALGIALGVTMTATPVAAHVTGSVAHLVKHLKKTFYTKKQIKKRFYTKAQVDGKLSDYYTKAEVDNTLSGYYTKAEIDTKLANVLTVETGNGVGGSFGCAGDTLAVRIYSANGEPVDFRFTFQVPGAPEAYGQIRSDGSVRNGSANVQSVTHTAGSGVYCIVFAAPAPNQAQLESAVVSRHFN